MTKSLFNRVALLIPATLLKERFREIDFPVNFAQFLKILFIEHLWVAASAPCKDFAILQILAISTKPRSFFLCYLCFFVILSLLFFLLCHPCVFSTSDYLQRNLQHKNIS